MTHTIWRCILFFLYYFIFLLGPSISKASQQKTDVLRMDFNNASLLYAMALNSILMLVFGLMLCKRKNDVPLKTSSCISALIFWGILILLCLFAANSAMSFLGKIWHWPYAGVRVIEPARHLYILIAFLCLLIGYSEEALFRKGARDIFSFLSVPAAHILMSLLFGLAHLAQGRIAWLFSTLSGGIFAYFYEFLSKKYGCWGWHCLSITHGVYNFMMIVLFTQM